MVNHSAKTLANRVHGLLGHDNAHARVLADQCGKAGNVGTATRQHDTKIENITRNFGGSFLNGGNDRADNGF